MARHGQVEDQELAQVARAAGHEDLHRPLVTANVLDRSSPHGRRRVLAGSTQRRGRLNKRVRGPAGPGSGRRRPRAWRPASPDGAAGGAGAGGGPAWVAGAAMVAVCRANPVRQRGRRPGRTRNRPQRPLLYG